MKFPKHSFVSAAWVLLFAGFSGCGPSSGGTGTGDGAPHLAAFGANSANVCAPPLVAALACPVGTGNITTPADNPGSAMVYFTDIAPGGQIAVVIQAHSIELSERCRRLRFTGDWGITASNDARFFGSYTLDNMGAVAASLSVQSGSGDKAGELQVLLRDAGGRIVLGPVTLRRVAAPVVDTAVCP